MAYKSTVQEERGDLTVSLYFIIQLWFIKNAVLSTSVNQLLGTLVHCSFYPLL
jgi:hypothetical protein